MTREEILEKSRKENQPSDEREQQIKIKSGFAAKLAGMAICLIVCLIAKLLGCPQSVMFAVVTVVWGMFAAEHWYLAVCLKKRFDLVAAIVYTVTAVLCVLCFVDFVKMGF